MLEGELETIQEYGLTEYEAKSYLALVELEEATAREVADVSRVPRTKIYGVIDDLHQKSLVEVIPERPKRFLPKPFHDYLDGYEDKFKERLKQVKEDKERFKGLIDSSGSPSIQGAGKFRVLKGRKNVLNRMLEMIEESEKSVWMLGSAFAPLRINYYSPLMHDKVEEDVIARVQCPIMSTNRMDIKETMAYADVRHRESENTGSSILVVDGEEALITHYIPDDTHLFKGEDVSMWTDDPAIVADLTELLSNTWTGAKSGQERIEEIPNVTTEDEGEAEAATSGTVDVEAE